MLRRLLPCAVLAPALVLALEDSSALVQQLAVAEQQASFFVPSPGSPGSPGEHSRVSCRRHPELCGDGVFNCDKPMEQEDIEKDITRETDGHPNPHALCGDAKIQSHKMCIHGDPIGAAALMYKMVYTTREEQAAYCWAAGHCNNTRVNENTTRQEAEELCDSIYGHGTWSGIGYRHIQGQRVSHGGRKNPFAHMACAEGRWHCDVVLCHEQYCNDHAWDRYKSLSFWTPGAHWAGVIPASHFREAEPSPKERTPKRPKSHRHQ
mmetsp:Transcript_69528/g.214913  ORF Transcript_69528/g.214913 Transcript_69528/m.214913 type:complete len:264 (-) Transcript_69528:143-934(-)